MLRRPLVCHCLLEKKLKLCPSFRKPPLPYKNPRCAPVLTLDTLTLCSSLCPEEPKFHPDDPAKTLTNFEIKQAGRWEIRSGHSGRIYKFMYILCCTIYVSCIMNATSLTQVPTSINLKACNHVLFYYSCHMKADLIWQLEKTRTYIQGIPCYIITLEFILECYPIARNYELMK